MAVELFQNIDFKYYKFKVYIYRSQQWTKLLSLLAMARFVGDVWFRQGKKQ